MPSNLSHSEDAVDSGQTTTNKVPLSDQKKRSINFWDKKCWQHRMSQVVFGYEQEDEMRAQEITFILCVELSLKTRLNSVLSGDHHVACLGIYLSPHAGFACETLTCQNQHLTQAVWVSSFTRWVIIYKQSVHVQTYCLREWQKVET